MLPDRRRVLVPSSVSAIFTMEPLSNSTYAALLLVPNWLLLQAAPVSVRLVVDKLEMMPAASTGVTMRCEKQVSLEPPPPLPGRYVSLAIHTGVVVWPAL